jgi:hypothetical protein
MYPKYEYDLESKELRVLEGSTVTKRIPNVTQVAEGQLQLEDSTVIDIMPSADGGIDGKTLDDATKLLEVTDFAAL